jgi:uncharacterized protein YerC
MKEIEGYPNYRVDIDGKVYSNYIPKTSKTGDEFREIKQVLDKGVGYYIVTLCYNGKRRNHFIHRLVATAFINNPENKPVVNHKDGDKTNNSISNLEWCTHQENAQHAVSFGLTTFTHCEVAILQIDLESNKVIAEFKSQKEAYDVTGIQKQNISKVCRGLRKHAGGYYWKYK